ncbi:MAG TPA: hypothetical protein VD999_04845 [Vitreimonas sp.]|nr:hypothetical protein [Vitreimonas sp.]
MKKTSSTFVWPQWLGHVAALVVMTLFSLWGAKALFHPGLYTAHDIWHQVARLYHYSQALQDGQFLPMWVGTLAFGYGYPLFIFSYHLPWLIAIPFLGAGMSVFATLKTLFGLSLIVSAVTMYVCVYYLTKSKLGSLVAAVIYAWAPYHFLSIYVSASIGNAWSFVFVPLLAWGLALVLDKKRTGGIVLIALSVAALILTHLMTLVLVLPPMILWFGIQWLIRWWPQREVHELKLSFLTLAAGIGLAFVITAFYLVPLITYLPIINAGQQGSGFKGLYERNLVTLKQLIYSPWGFGPIVDNAKDGEISFQVGIAQWLAMGMAGLAWLAVLIKSRKNDAALLALGTAYAFTILLMIDISKPLWLVVDSAISIDYPFRLLLVAVFFGSLAAGYVIAQLPWKFIKVIVSVLLIGVAVYTNRNHIRVNQYTDVPLQLYIDSELTTNTFHEYLPKGQGMVDPWVGNPLARSPLLSSEQLQARGLTTQVGERYPSTKLSQTTTQLEFVVQLEKDSDVALHHYVFPGIKVLVNGQPVEFELDANTVIFKRLPAGEHTITIRYERPSWVYLGYLVSLLGLGSTGYLGYRALSTPRSTHQRKS